ncbi:MAG: hypothetical protein ABIO05_03795, partial [Ferruginibacter sp.]
MKNFTKSLLMVLLVVSANVYSQPKLNSNPPLANTPDTIPTIFIDFDGHKVSGTLWVNGGTINAAPSGLSDIQITEIFNRVSEDYRPFNINVTTDSTKFLAAPLNRRIRIIVTPTSSWVTGVGGVA